MKNTKLITMIEGAIIAAIAVALSYIPLNTANAAFDLSLGLIPLGVYALRRGLVPGMAVGFVWGLLLIVLGKAWFLSIPQVLIEYPVAFAFGGFGGIFAGRLRRKKAENNMKSVVLTAVFAGIVAAAARWFFHYWAGLVFWMDTVPAGANPYWYVLGVNAGSAIANAIMLAIILSILVRTARTLFSPKDVL